MKDFVNKGNNIVDHAAVIVITIHDGNEVMMKMKKVKLNGACRLVEDFVNDGDLRERLLHLFKAPAPHSFAGSPPHCIISC